MKTYLLLLLVLALTIAIEAALIGGKSINIRYSGPQKMQVSATLYGASEWAGTASMETDGRTIPLQIYDMAYDQELNTVTICPGTDENNFYCQTFEYRPGEAVQHSDGKGGVAEYNVNLQLA